MQSLKVIAQEKGIRLDAFLAAQADITRSRVQGLLEQGCVRLNGEVPSKAGVKLRVGDEVTMDIPAAVPARAVAQEIPLDIVYQDSDIVVVNKARGMVVHPAAGHAQGTLVNALLAACGDLSGIGGEMRPGIVHRLDKDTTGLLVAAKNDEAHQSLSHQMKERTAGREYITLVRGAFREEDGEIISRIGRHPRDRKRMAVLDLGGREAITRWYQMERQDGSALLRVKLLTGRTHQIRVHMAHAGHPVLGDPLYGIKSDKTPVLMLHAAKLSFVHPRTQERLSFFAPPPQDFMGVLEARGYLSKEQDDWIFDSFQ